MSFVDASDVPNFTQLDLSPMSLLVLFVLLFNGLMLMLGMEAKPQDHRTTVGSIFILIVHTSLFD